jgi:uncharacterized protein
METKIFAVIDTNVIVSALLSRNPDAKTKQVLDLVLGGSVTPLFCQEIIDEYSNVLSRSKFPFKPEDVHNLIVAFTHFGLDTARTASDEVLPDPKDVAFYEVALSVDESFLVTGNTKHFPKKPIVVTPAEFIEIISPLLAL